MIADPMPTCTTCGGRLQRFADGSQGWFHEAQGRDHHRECWEAIRRAKAEGAEAAALAELGELGGKLRDTQAKLDRTRADLDETHDSFDRVSDTLEREWKTMRDERDGLRQLAQQALDLMDEGRSLRAQALLAKTLEAAQEVRQEKGAT